MQLERFNDTREPSPCVVVNEKFNCILSNIGKA